MAALHAIARRRDHVVAKVVEAKFGIGTVGDGGGVRGSALLGLHAVLDKPNLHAEQPVYAANPFRIALRQVIVDGDDVNRIARQCVQEAHRGGDERLSLASLHFGDAPIV